MAQNAATDGLIMHLLLSVKQGANQFPNINFVKNNEWDAVKDLPEDAPFGRGLFKVVGQDAYETAQTNLADAEDSDLRDDAFVLTRSVERLTANAADEGDGNGVWSGPSPHPDTQMLAGWVNALNNA